MPNSHQMPWTREKIDALFALPFSDLVMQAQSALRAQDRQNEVQLCQLLSIKTGGCPEDCGYCSQSLTANGAVAAQKLMDAEAIAAAAQQARDAGATRFCMGAAWRSLKPRDLDRVCTIISQVKALGLETCMTLGMLEEGQAETLRDAGLDYYNHNLDTSPEYYPKVITTRTYEERLQTLEKVREAGMKTCCGGIVGMGESADDRTGLLLALAALPEAPHSVPINRLVPVPGTRLAGSEEMDAIEFARVIAVARIMFPTSEIRLSAGRESLGNAGQALCFLAGADSIFCGEQLLTAPNTGAGEDEKLMRQLGLRARPAEENTSSAPQ